MSPVLTLGDGQNAGGDPSFTPRGRPSPGLSGRPNPQRTKITRIRRKHTNLDPCILPDSPSRSHNAMGRLWNRLLSHSVAPMLIADIGGITTAPPKSPCPSAPNRPASTTIRPQDPNRQLQSLTGPGSGAGLPQRQRYTPGHHTPSEKRGEKHRFGHCARACKGIVAHNPAQTQAHMHKTKTRRLVYCPPALTQTVSGRRGVHTCMRMHVLHTSTVVFPHLFYVFIRCKRWNTSKLM